MEPQETLKLAEETAREVIKVAKVEADKLLEKDASTRVTYEDWYNQQLLNKDRFDNLHKQIQAMHDRQPNVFESLLQKYVNGKIDKIDYALKEYIKDDNKWKEQFQPTLTGLVNLTGGAKIIVWVIASLGAVVASLIAIRNFIR